MCIGADATPDEADKLAESTDFIQIQQDELNKRLRETVKEKSRCPTAISFDSILKSFIRFKYFSLCDILAFAYSIELLTLL